jgi:hypothetical protein
VAVVVVPAAAAVGVVVPAAVGAVVVAVAVVPVAAVVLAAAVTNKTYLEKSEYVKYYVGFEVFTAVTTMNAISGMWHHVGLL